MKIRRTNKQHHQGPVINSKPICKITKDGAKEWYLNGKLHRVKDGPAVEYADGTKYWYIKGKLHREDGPAIEYSNGTKIWYLNDKSYQSKSEYYLALIKWWEK